MSDFPARRRILISLAASTSLCLISRFGIATAYAESRWLARLSGFRGLSGPFRFSLKIVATKGDVAEENTADVFFRSHQQVLVLFRSPANVAGRRILVDADAMWLALPSSQRVLRILPSQRLLGEASNGDIVNTDFSKYEVAEERNETYQGHPAVRVCLTATRSDQSYQRIDYIIDPTTVRPRASEHYSASGRLLKTIEYLTFQKVGNEEKLHTLRIVNNLMENQVTEMTFEHYAPQNLPAGAYAKASLLGLDL